MSKIKAVNFNKKCKTSVSLITTRCEHGRFYAETVTFVAAGFESWPILRPAAHFKMGWPTLNHAVGPFII